MLKVGAIQKSVSPWASPVVLVCKKDGSLRFCIDLHKLNSHTIKDAYSLPQIEESLDCLNGAKIFTSLDLKSGILASTTRRGKHTPDSIHSGAIRIL